VAAEFLQHANEEQGHADQIARESSSWGGEPNLSPTVYQVQPTRIHRGNNSHGYDQKDLVAERVAIDSTRNHQFLVMTIRPAAACLNKFSPSEESTR